MNLTDTKMDFWIKNNLNVLFRGKHGIGKSTKIIDRFNANGLKWMYFSAATMDPWVDFIGVPKEVVDNTTGKSYLKLIKPQRFEDDDVEAIMFDEFNRAGSKVRNAVMELIQFKSINGRKFNKLRMIWAAVNPDDENSYDVERLDPAQEDRFHVIISLPYKPDSEYFFNKFGENGRVACTWWNKLEEDQKDRLSPRRLEYMLQMFEMGGDVNDILPENINSNDLVLQLSSGLYTERLLDIFNRKDVALAIKSLNNENFYNGTISTILENEEYRKFFLNKLPKEKISMLMTTDKNVVYWFAETENYNDYKSICEPLLQQSESGGSANEATHIILSRWKRQCETFENSSVEEIIDGIIDEEKLKALEDFKTRCQTNDILEPIIYNRLDGLKDDYLFKLVSIMWVILRKNTITQINEMQRSMLGKVLDALQTRGYSVDDVMSKKIPKVNFISDKSTFKKGMVWLKANMPDHYGSTTLA